MFWLVTIAVVSAVYSQTDASSSEVLVINEDEQNNASATVHAIPEKCHNQQAAHPFPLKTTQVMERERRKKLVDANLLQDTTRSDFDQVSQSLSISLKKKHPAERNIPLKKQSKMTVFHRSKRSLILNQNKGEIFKLELELSSKATEDSSFSDIKKSSLFSAQKWSHRTQKSKTPRTGYFILNVRPGTEFFRSSKTTIMIRPKANFSQISRTNLAESSDARYVESSDNELSESLETQFLDVPKVNFAESLKTTVSHSLEADFSEISASKYKKIVEENFSKSPRSKFSGNSRTRSTKSPETMEVPITSSLNDIETYFPASLKADVVRGPRVNSAGIPGTNLAENSGTKYSSKGTRANSSECSGTKTSGNSRTENEKSREMNITENSGTNTSKTTSLSGSENPRTHSRKSARIALSENLGTNYSKDPGTNFSENSKANSTDSKEANVSESPATNFPTSSDSRLQVRALKNGPKGLDTSRKIVSDSPKSSSSGSSSATFYSASSTLSSPKNPGTRDIPITESPKNRGIRDIPITESPKNPGIRDIPITESPRNQGTRELAQGKHPGSSSADLGTQAPSRSPRNSKQDHSGSKRSGLRLRTRALNVVKQGLSSVDSFGRNLFKRGARTQLGGAALKRARSLGRNQYLQMGASVLSNVYGAVWSRVPSKETLMSARNAALRTFMAATVNLTTVDRIRALLEWNYIRPYLEHFIPPPKYSVPENVEDKHNGILLKMLMSNDNGPAILCLIKIIAKHVTVDEKSTPENPIYKMSYQCLLNTAVKLHKKGYLKPRKDISKMEVTIAREQSNPCLDCTPQNQKGVQILLKDRLPDPNELVLEILLYDTTALLSYNVINAVKKNVTVKRVKSWNGKRKHMYVIDFIGIASTPGMKDTFKEINGLAGEILRKIAPEHNNGDGNGNGKGNDNGNGNGNGKGNGNDKGNGKRNGKGNR